jgi:HEAT repeat protein
MLDEEQSAKLDALLDDPTALVGQINDSNGRRFEQIARGGPPTARVLAVRALGRSGDLDYSPTLIYALTDPDKRVVREARDGLRFISRKFEGYGLADDYKDPELRDAIERWKSWYLSVRPDGAIDLN